MHEHYADQLFVPAIDAIHVSVIHHLREGWYVNVWHRHSGSDGTECPSDTYGPLVVGLVLEVADAALSGLLEWP
jgi:hypothetical protein